MRWRAIGAAAGAALAAGCSVLSSGPTEADVLAAIRGKIVWGNMGEVTRVSDLQCRESDTPPSFACSFTIHGSAGQSQPQTASFMKSNNVWTMLAR
jgi:hypothetical protein